MALSDTFNASLKDTYQKLVSPPPSIHLYDSSLVAASRMADSSPTTVFVGQIPLSGSKGLTYPSTAALQHLDNQNHIISSETIRCVLSDVSDDKLLRSSILVVDKLPGPRPTAITSKYSIGEVMGTPHYQKRWHPKKIAQFESSENLLLARETQTLPSKLLALTSDIIPDSVGETPVMRYQRNQAIPSSHVSVKIYIVAMLLSILYCLA